MKMKDRNEQLKRSLGAMASKETVQEIKNVPKEDTVNRQGFKAYSLSDKLRLLTMLNTLKIQPQYYRTEDETISELRDLVERIAIDDPYFVCQAIIYSRCMGEGMRTINHLAAVLVAPFIKGQEWAGRFYRLFDKKLQKGGCIFRPDDMSEIKDAWFALNQKGLPASMRRGFAYNLENYDTYQLAKYKKSNIDIANLVHPDSKKSNTVVAHDSEIRKVLDLLMQGVNIVADTWEAAQSEAGQEVAKAIKEGKLTEDEAEKVLAEAKADNWESLLKDGKLGILAALRNIRNIMKNPRREIIDMWCKLIKNVELIRKGLILPIHFDLAYDVVSTEFSTYDYAHEVMTALQDAYQSSIPNLSSVFTGKTCIIVDCSGSMGTGISDGKKVYGRVVSWYDKSESTTCCKYKAGLIAATIAKACDVDIVKFGSRAEMFNFNKHENVFQLAKEIGTDRHGGTSPWTAWDLITKLKKKYDRVIFISDNEVNSYNLTSEYYKRYLRICSPYVYAIDLAAYGTTPLAGNKIAYFNGYGPSLYEDITKNEFNPEMILDKVLKIVI